VGARTRKPFHLDVSFNLKSRPWKRVNNPLNW